METTEGSTPVEAIGRWVEALNRRGEADTVAAALHEEARVERCGVGDLRGEVVEIFTGLENITRWVRLTPEGILFSLATEVEAIRDEDGAGFSVEYRMEAGDFVNGGCWRFRLGPLGLLMWLKHIPGQPAGMATREVRDPSETWRSYTREIPIVHAHDHDHDH